MGFQESFATAATEAGKAAVSAYPQMQAQRAKRAKNKRDQERYEHQKELADLIEQSKNIAESYLTPIEQSKNIAESYQTPSSAQSQIPTPEALPTTSRAEVTAPSRGANVVNPYLPLEEQVNTPSQTPKAEVGAKTPTAEVVSTTLQGALPTTTDVQAEVPEESFFESAVALDRRIYAAALRAFGDPAMAQLMLDRQVLQRQQRGSELATRAMGLLEQGMNEQAVGALNLAAQYGHSRPRHQFELNKNGEVTYDGEVVNTKKAMSIAQMVFGDYKLYQKEYEANVTKDIDTHRNDLAKDLARNQELIEVRMAAVRHANTTQQQQQMIDAMKSLREAQANQLKMLTKQTQLEVESMIEERGYSSGKQEAALALQETAREAFDSFLDRLYGTSGDISTDALVAQGLGLPGMSAGGPVPEFFDAYEYVNLAYATYSELVIGAVEKMEPGDDPVYPDMFIPIAFQVAQEQMVEDQGRKMRAPPPNTTRTDPNTTRTPRLPPTDERKARPWPGPTHNTGGRARAQGTDLTREQWDEAEQLRLEKQAADAASARSRRQRLRDAHLPTLQQSAIPTGAPKPDVNWWRTPSTEAPTSGIPNK